MSITLDKKFHGTTVTIPVIKRYTNDFGRFAEVSEDDFIFAQRELCGMDDCVCGVVYVGVVNDFQHDVVVV
jgi:hypothetical protein